MNWSRVSSGLRRLSGKSPAEIVERLAGAFHRRLWAKLEPIIDHTRTTYGPPSMGERGSILAHAPDLPSQSQYDVLKRLNADVRRHCFDIFGSGPVVVRHGVRCAGFGGVHFASMPSVVPDEQGGWLAGHVTGPALADSQRIWRLIWQGEYAPRVYEPIDWQCDFRSGYRWDARRHWRNIEIGNVRGADIKVPWELARMQHLPRLAYGVLAAKAAGAHDDVLRNTVEIRAQILDFIAGNPPRFGVNWCCAMEVAIRGANISLALDLLVCAGFNLDAAAMVTIDASLRDHANHVLANLEWSEETRGNHYLANVTGLLFIVAGLPRSAQSDATIAFAAHELDVEIRRQFLADGGSFEGSTGYHRLSGEMAIWAAALLARLATTRDKVFRDFDSSRIRPRPGMPEPPLPENPTVSGAPFNDETLARLRALANFAVDTRHADGTALLIGDDDSGRFFDLQLPETKDKRPDRRDRAAMIGMANVLFREAKEIEVDIPLEAQLVSALTGGMSIKVSADNYQVNTYGERSSLDQTLARIEIMPANSRQRFVFPWRRGHASEKVETSAYPIFGLYLIKAEGVSLAIRCFAPPDLDAAGHTHDDNLSMSLKIGENTVVTDPGTYCYTPFPEIRRLYQGIGSHFAPRPQGREAMVYGDGCFSVAHTAHGRCLYFSADGFAGELLGPDWHVLRVVRLTRSAVIVDDGCATGPLAPYSVLTASHKVCRGYGEETGYTPYTV